jgi:hypothetical protein
MRRVNTSISFRLVCLCTRVFMSVHLDICMCVRQCLQVCVVGPPFPTNAWTHTHRCTNHLYLSPAPLSLSLSPSLSLCLFFSLSLTHTHANKHTHTHTHAHTHTHTHAHAHTHTPHALAYTHVDRQTGRQVDRQTHTSTHAHPYTHAPTTTRIPRPPAQYLSRVMKKKEIEKKIHLPIRINFFITWSVPYTQMNLRICTQMNLHVCASTGNV